MPCPATVISSSSSGRLLHRKYDQTRGEFQIAQPVYRTLGERSGIALEAEDELRVGQNQAQRALDSFVETAACVASGLIEAQQRLHIVVGDRTTIGLPSKLRKNLTRAGYVFGFPAGLAREDLTAAGRIAGTGSFVRTRDHEIFDVRQPDFVHRIEGDALERLQDRCQSFSSRSSF